jgi:hypothetical protein
MSLKQRKEAASLFLVLLFFTVFPLLLSSKNDLAQYSTEITKEDDAPAARTHQASSRDNIGQVVGEALESIHTAQQPVQQSHKEEGKEEASSVVEPQLYRYGKSQRGETADGEALLRKGSDNAEQERPAGSKPTRKHLTLVVPPYLKDGIACQGKEKILAQLVNASIPLDSINCSNLPSWEEVRTQYGNDPIIHGLNTCETYRAMVRNAGQPPKPRLAGLFNTGTNLLNKLFTKNFGNLPKLKRNEKPYGVPWGKHSLAKYRLQVKYPLDHPDPSPKLVLPIVVVRDPYQWMQSMCKKPYALKWNHDKGHPNLFLSTNKSSSSIGVSANSNANATMNQVTLEYPELDRCSSCSKTDSFESLASVWTNWNRQYVFNNASYPRLVIRYEDLLFHAEHLFQKISECAGISTITARFKYQVGAAKKHGKPSGMLDQIAKLVNATGRTAGLSSLELDYAEQVLEDSNLMRVLGYVHPRRLLASPK